jgi:hypothetical protein
MAKLSDKELAKVNEIVQSVNALNKQVLDYSFAQFKACQLKDAAEQRLGEFYNEMAGKYNDGKPMDLNIETGVVGPAELIKE